MLKKIIFSTAIILISLFLCSAGCETISGGGGGSSSGGGYTGGTSDSGGGSSGGGSSGGGSGSTPPKPVPLTKIEFANATVVIPEGVTRSIADIAPLIFTPSKATNKKVTYSIERNSFVELVDGTKLKGVAKGGPITLTATSADSNHKAECKIEVTDYIPLQSISFNPDTIMIKVGETVNVAPYLEFTPPNASNKDVEFTVEDGSRFWLTQNNEKGSVTGNRKTWWDSDTLYDVAVVNAVSKEDSNINAELKVVVGNERVNSLSNYNNFPVYVDSSNFEENKMYIFIRVVGESQEGRFKIISRNLTGGTSTTYPKKLYFQTKEGTNPDYYAYINSSQINTSNATYGFTESTGKTLDTKSYFGSDKFGISKNGNTDLTFTMRNFTIEDPTDASGWLGASSTIARCSDITFIIPMSGFNSTNHQNKAAFTLKLTPIKSGNAETGKYTATATFDGFVQKN